MTTHFMEEADMLGDMIAIMSKGKSPKKFNFKKFMKTIRIEISNLFFKLSQNFLKKNIMMIIIIIIIIIHFPSRLSLLCRNVLRSENGVRSWISVNISERQKQWSRGDWYVYGEVLGKGGNQKKNPKLRPGKVDVTYQIPHQVSEVFPKFFKKLDAKMEELKILSFGLHTTTLEEVFLKIVMAVEEEGKKEILTGRGVKKNEDERHPEIEPGEDDEVIFLKWEWHFFQHAQKKDARSIVSVWK